MFTVSLSAFHPRCFHRLAGVWASEADAADATGCRTCQTTLPVYNRDSVHDKNTLPYFGDELREETELFLEYNR